MKLVTSQEMRELEKRADASGNTFAAMMERAGTLAARAILERVAASEKRALVLVGPGNNGGDGLVCARTLHDAGKQVMLYFWKRDLAAPDENFDACRARQIDFFRAEEDTEGNDNFARLKKCLSEADILVDALLGTGVTRPITDVLKDLLEVVKTQWVKAERARELISPRVVSPPRKDKKVFAIDLPSGLNPDTGALDSATLSADCTVTFAFPKHGQLLYPGADAVGELVVADIGIPREWADAILFDLATTNEIGGMLPARPGNSNKGSFGKALIVAGSKNYVGAVALAGEGAARVGAGLVTLAIPETIYTALASKLTVTTFLPLPDKDGAMSPLAVKSVVDQVANYDALLVGCGFGRASATIQFVRDLLDANLNKMSVLDADALFALAQIDGWRKKFSSPPILTPHPGEMARLTGLSVEQIQSDRWGVAEKFAGEWNAVVVLKGAHTVIAAPEGQVCVLPFANPALATAGTGDVLAGAIVGLLAQGLTPFDAARVGAFVHAYAGESVRFEIGSAGAVASDLIPRLPRAIREIMEGR